MKNIVVIIFSVLLLSSCSRNIYNCAETDAREPAINISIVDSEGNSLIGEDNIYKPSEITLTRGDQTIFLVFIEFSEETQIRLFYSEMESGKDYKLKLNDQESDVLNLKLKTLVSECFDFLSVDAFFLNGEEAELNNDSYSYIIQK